MGYPAQGTIQYVRNISNNVATGNPVSCPVGVDTVLPLNNGGTNKFQYRNVGIGKLEFDPAYLSNKGALLTYLFHPDSFFDARITFVNTGAANTTAVFRMFLVFDKDVPGTGVAINSSPVEIKTTLEQTVFLSAFSGGIEAIYFICNPAVTTTIRMNGALMKVGENP